MRELREHAEAQAALFRIGSDEAVDLPLPHGKGFDQ